MIARVFSGVSVFVMTAALAAGCSSSSNDGASSGTPGGEPPDGGGPTSDGGGSAQPLYAMMIQVYSDQDRTVYVSLSNTLDITSTFMENAREFPGVANLAAVSGKLLVSSGIEPKITEFDFGKDNAWIEGRSVSFAAYPLSDNANFYAQFIADKNNAILPYDGTKRLVWDPTEMIIKSNLTDSSIVASDGANILEPGGNRNGVTYDGSFLQAYFYHDNDWFTYGTKSHIVSYNAGTFTEKKVWDLPCPGLTLATRDEQGNTYFATWDLPLSTLKGSTPATCVAKFDASNELVGTMDSRTWAGGRWVNNLRYVGNGKAFGNVLHHEALGVTSTSQLTDEQLSELWKDGPHWKLWMFDVNAGTGVPVEGIDMPITGGAQMATLEGRTFMFVPYQEWGRTRAYELSADGKATQRFDTVGDIFKWVKIR